jgi:AcrR family transcriptional regulator
VAAVSTERLGLRERKKQRTRMTIVDVATRLFHEQGYNETTLVQIADAAEIAPSTFFNYFPSKVDVVFGLVDAVVESARARILGRPPGEPAAEAIVAWVREDLPDVERPYSEILRRIPAIIQSVPELVAEERLRFGLLDDVFADGFAADLGEPAAGMRPRVMAAIALRAMLDVWAAWHLHHASDAELDLSELCAIKADYLETVLASGLIAIESLPPAPDEA